MSRYTLTDEDVYVGAELLCISVVIEDDIYTVGNMYRVTANYGNGRYPYCLSSDKTGVNIGFNLEELNDSSSLEPSFIPLSHLNSEEQFLHKISGKLPERYNA